MILIPRKMEMPAMSSATMRPIRPSPRSRCDFCPILWGILGFELRRVKEAERAPKAGIGDGSRVISRSWRAFERQDGDGGSPSAPSRRGVLEAEDERGPFQDLPDDLPLNTHAPAMDDAD